jgi:hypothetical protein
MVAKLSLVMLLVLAHHASGSQHVLGDTIRKLESSRQLQCGDGELACFFEGRTIYNYQCWQCVAYLLCVICSMPTTYTCWVTCYATREQPVNTDVTSHQSAPPDFFRSAVPVSTAASGP